MYRLSLVFFAAGFLSAQEPHPQTLPKWFEWGTEVRGRMEGNHANNFVAGADDHYYYHRIRLDLGVKPFAGFRVHVQLQENEAPGFNKPVPSTSAAGVDVHQAFLEWVGKAKEHWGVRVGRQELPFGNERLMGASNWGNAGRAFDAVRVFYENPKLRVDWFASTLVAVDPDHWDKFSKSPQVHGVYVVAKGWLPQGTVEPYCLVKIDPRDTSELNRPGRTQVYTPGVRFLGKLPHRFDYLGENAFQWGRIGAERQRAWAGNWNLGYTLPGKATAPRIIGTYSHSSGDERLGDGRRGTFDQMYPTNHSLYGLADRVGWRNMQELEGSLIWPVDAKWNLRGEYHTFWLANKADAFYTEAGRVLVRNTAATSTHLGQELCGVVTYRLNKRVEFLGGGGRFFAGEYLRQSNRNVASGIFWLQWRYSM